MFNFVFKPNKQQKYFLILTSAITLLSCIAIGMMIVYQTLTNQNMNWGLLFILIFIICLGILTTVNIYSAASTTLIFTVDGLHILNVKKNPYTYLAWKDVNYYNTFSDAFGRHYVVLSKDNKISISDSYITRNISHVVLSDDLIAFIVQNTVDQNTISEIINKSVIH